MEDKKTPATGSRASGKYADSAEYVVIGGGLAGMSTAWHLTLRGADDILVLEKEDLPGMHSSGRNASMVRQVVPDKDVLGLAAEGSRFFRSEPEGWDEPVPFTLSGSLLVASGESLAGLREEAQAARRAGVKVEFREPGRIMEDVPCTAGGDFAGGVFCPTDGVADTERLVAGYLAAARKKGARLLTGCEVRGFETSGPSVTGVRTGKGLIRAGKVVNAAGPWAGVVGRMAGALDIGFTPLRRHLYYTGPLNWADENWPFVWDVSRDVYFRPESNGLLLSACDECEVEPALPVVDQAVQDMLAAKMERSFPRLLDAPIARTWAGIRTFAPDHRFVIGWDPRLERFYWVAGLGGHGVTTSPAVGRLAAGELVSGEQADGNAFSPSRFTGYGRTT